ncbi:MAG: hypothetical protein WAM53_01660 [Terrimicrobiaceae bacterium]
MKHNPVNIHAQATALTPEIINDLRAGITTHTWFCTPQLLDCLDRWEAAGTTHERSLASGQFCFLVDEETYFQRKALKRIRKH